VGQFGEGVVIPLFALVIQTDLLTFAEIETFRVAMQSYIDGPFHDAWELPAALVTVPKGNAPPEGSWPVYLCDRSTIPDALAFHVDPDGVPTIYVACGDARDDGVIWTLPASHDIIETVIDPGANLTVPWVLKGVAGKIMKEAADACEDPQFAVTWEGVVLTAFVTPAYFVLGSEGPWTYPVIPSITEAGMLAEGGYVGFLPDGGTWSQVLADGVPGVLAVNKKPWSRTLRRFGRA
jgi:hypothetical protein